jgi:hypothetical protein
MVSAADSTQLRAELALMSIFRDLGVSADAPVPLVEITRRWSDYGVRVTDLPGAVDRLIQRGLLSRRQEVPTYLARTPAGRSWFDEQPAWLEYQLLVPRALRARYQRELSDRAPVPLRRRRSGESSGRRESA